MTNIVDIIDIVYKKGRDSEFNIKDTDATELLLTED